MAQSTLHFAAGMAIGTAAALPSLAAAWRNGRPLAAPFLRWFLCAYGIGAFAIVPNLLRRWGCSPERCESVWMNLFLLHPLIDRAIDRHILIGELAVTGLFCAQYGLLLLAIRHTMRPAADRAARE